MAAILDLHPSLSMYVEVLFSSLLTPFILYFFSMWVAFVYLLSENLIINPIAFQGNIYYVTSHIKNALLHITAICLCAYNIYLPSTWSQVLAIIWHLVSYLFFLEHF